MTGRLAALAAATLILLSGCTSMFNPLNSSVAAEELDPVLLQNALGQTSVVDTTTNQRIYHVPNVNDLAILINDSQTKCQAFVSRLSVGENGSTTVLDIITTGANAIASVFTPLATVHALSATAAIASGSRANISADIYGQATIANFADAINTTYYSAMGKETEYLEANGTTVIPALEVEKIQAIHAECSLGSAEHSVDAALHKDANSITPAKTTTTTFTIKATDANGKIKKTTAFGLSGVPTTGVTLTFKAGPYKIGSTESPDQVAGQLKGDIDSDPNFLAAQVTAAIDSSNAANLIITSPAASGFKWTATPPTNFIIATPPPAPADTGSGAPPPQQTADTGSTSNNATEKPADAGGANSPTPNVAGNNPFTKLPQTMSPSGQASAIVQSTGQSLIVAPPPPVQTGGYVPGPMFVPGSFPGASQ